ncbi:hypothetical protein BH20ACI4_BH20ACI4_09780 [soil metagenome]
MFKNLLKTIFVLIFTFIFFSNHANAQRDNLTFEEIEMIRDEQELDKRMEIYVKAVDRRLMVLKNTTAANTKEIEKDSDKWGALPKGTKVELLSDIRKILDETIDKVDDVYERDPKNEWIPYSLHLLADGAKRFVPELQKLKETTTDGREIGLINNSVESCEQIIETAAKIPRPEKKPKKKKDNSANP